MAEVAGTTAPGFERLKAAFAEGQSVDAGGAQLCIYRRGEPVVDLWTGEGFGPDTVTVLMSCTKAAAAVCAHILAERGVLDLEAPVATYWPEFAAAGKETITTAHVLSHSAGLMGFGPDAGIDVDALLDWKACTSALAWMVPLWRPGESYLYHVVTYGYLLGEVVRRASGRTLGQVMAEEVAAPLCLDLWLGLPEREESRVAYHLRGLPPTTEESWTNLFKSLGIDPADPLIAAIVDAYVVTEDLIEAMNTRPFRAAEIAAGNGVGNARSLARMYAACIGEVDGIRLISPKTVERMRAPRTDHIAAPPPLPSFKSEASQRFGLGFELPRSTMPMLDAGSFGHPGAGGRVAFADPESGFAVAYVCNNMLWDGQTPDPRWGPWLTALQEIVHG